MDVYLTNSCGKIDPLFVSPNSGNATLGRSSGGSFYHGLGAPVCQAAGWGGIDGGGEVARWIGFVEWGLVAGRDLAAGWIGL